MIASHQTFPFTPPPAVRPAQMARAVTCDERGLHIGTGTLLVRMAGADRLAVEADGVRCIALLSVLCRQSLGPELLRPIEAAAAYWVAGDKALANLRLVFSSLPRLRSVADAARLDAAAWCLDHGVAPCDLLKALDLDPSTLELCKFNPDQPRVPAGSGRESGRWTEGDAAEHTNDLAEPSSSAATSHETGSSAAAVFMPAVTDDWQACHEKCLEQTEGTWPSSDRPGLYRKCMRECLGGNY